MDRLSLVEQRSNPKVDCSMDSTLCPLATSTNPVANGILKESVVNWGCVFTVIFLPPMVFLHYKLVFYWAQQVHQHLQIGIWVPRQISSTFVPFSVKSNSGVRFAPSTRFLEGCILPKHVQEKVAVGLSWAAFVIVIVVRGGPAAYDVKLLQRRVDS